MGNVSIQTNSVPINFCFQSWSQSWPVLVSLLNANLLGDVNTFNFGSTTPTPENQDKPWFRLNSDGSPDRWYKFHNGLWVSRHSVPPNAGAVILFQGAESAIDTFDGGESAAVTDTAGPMWEKVPELNARSPLGPGTLPSGVAVNQGDAGGEEKHTLLEAELAAHSHAFGSGDFPKSFNVSLTGREGSINQTGSLDYKTLLPLQNAGSSQPFNVLHPYYGIFFLRRTARIFYRL